MVFNKKSKACSHWLLSGHSRSRRRRGGVEEGRGLKVEENPCSRRRRGGVEERRGEGPSQDGELHTSKNNKKTLKTHKFHANHEKNKKKQEIYDFVKFSMSAGFFDLRV